MEPYSSGVPISNDDPYESRLDRGNIFRHLLLFGCAVFIVRFIYSHRRQTDGLLTVNRKFFWEPSYFARFRWITKADEIIAAADLKAQGQPYRLVRGDTEQIVLPVDMIPELNALGIDILNSRESHAFSLLGHLTGMDVVRHTSFHVRVLLSYISPALPDLFAITGERIAASIATELSQSHAWTPLKPHRAIVRSIGEAIALSLFGAEMTDGNSELVHLTHEHTNNGK